MNLPVRVDDPSLLEHEPLRSHIAVLKCTEGQRSQANNSISAFAEDMRRDGQAAAAAKKWASFVFQDVLSDEHSFETTDEGEALYKIFFKYYCWLHKGRQNGDFEEACRYVSRVQRNGISAVKIIIPKARGANTQDSARGRSNGRRSKRQDNQRSSRPKKTCRQVKTSTYRPDTGDGMASSSLGHESHSMPGPVFALPSVTGARLSTLSEAANSTRRSTSKKKKKRKASSQKPPVITPSDASEDDKEPHQTHATVATDSIFHLSKRAASNPSYNLLGVNNEVDTAISVHRAETDEQYRGDAPGISPPQSPLTSPAPEDFVSKSVIRDKPDAGERLFNTPNRPKRSNSISRRVQKVKPLKDLHLRANKRMCRASMSVLDREAGEEPEPTHNSQAQLLQQDTVRTPLASDSPLTGGITHVESKARKKRARLDFETPFVASDENESAISHELLGPDVRLSRPLPKKVRDVRLLPAGHGVLCGVSSLEHADQLLRDVAGNELAMLQVGVDPDLPDWTQDREHDDECDDSGDDDQDDANDVQATTATSTPPKPPVLTPPRIWAQSRQEVCESFEYFRSYHSGVYSKGEIVKGYLLGAYAASRDIFHHDGKLIISHGGGKSESILDVRRGPKRYQMDQDQEATDKSVRALLKTYRDRRPIVLLADDKYALFPYDLTSANYTYVVLGLYWISHAWAECQPARDGSGRIVRWKFTFQWCEGQGNPWWPPQQDLMDIMSNSPKSISKSSMCPAKDSSNPPDTGGNLSMQCETCHEHAPFVYKQGWMCLNPHCNLFWSINGEEPKQLDYREEFLSLLPQEFERLPNITPTKVVEMPSGVTTTYAFSKGWHCTSCGRLSCRYKWEYWECSNCKLRHVVNGRVRSPKEFWHQRPAKGFLHSQIGKDSGILACRMEPINLGEHKGFTNRLTFILPYGRGKIHLILGTPLSNGDADNIFQLYQQQATIGELKLRRYPLRNHRARGLLLTNYFSQNSGEPYQYVGGSGQTVPFTEAPECVQRALGLIKERASLALRTDIPFNEILTAAYMERQKMSFHSDSEKGLGPTVASLSLGSAALMHFRPHANLNMEDPKARSGYALTLVLRHGDVLIMDGDGVQKYYEHTVIPMNFRIAATARCIGAA